MKKLSIIIATVIIFALSLLHTGCTNGFDSMNEDPNNPIKVPASNILARAIHYSFDPIWDVRMNCYYAGAYSGMVGAPDYEYRNTINTSMFNNMYVCMQYCVKTMGVAEEEENFNIYAAALTLKVYYAQLTTDSWGDIPYSEAFRLVDGIEFVYPHYDKQKDVYIQMLAELKEAADLFDTNGPSVGVGDYLFNGNVAKWQKFCNSLRLRVAIRGSSGDPAIASSTIAEVLGNPTSYPIISTNADNAYWWFPGISPDLEIWYTSYMGTMGRDANGVKNTIFRPQQPFIDALQDNNDPRLPVYFDKNIQDGIYAGHRFGPNDASDPYANNNNYRSAFGDRFTNDPAGFEPFMNAAEVQFCIAEAYARGVGVTANDANARTAYEKGINLSCEENGITDADGEITDFLAENGVVWNGTDAEKLGKIALQKWIVLIKQSMNAWAEVRRTNVPDLKGWVQSVYWSTHDYPPFRMYYSDTEALLNPNFPKDVVSKDIFWGDRVWWDNKPEREPTH